MSDPASILGQIASLQGMAMICTIVLFLLCLAVLPRDERKELRLPLLLLVGHVAIAVSAFTLHQGRPSRAVTIAMVVLLFAALARVSFLFIADWLIGKRLKHPLPKIFRDIVQALFYLTLAIFALHELGVDLSSLLTTSAVLTAVIGLSLQETLGNVFAGLAVQAERPFEIGDWVQFGEDRTLIGQVLEINWRATKLRTPDQNEIIVPNAIIAKSSIQNFRRPDPIVRRTVSFQAQYEVTPNVVEQAVLGSLGQVAGVAGNPPPQLWTDGFADSGINYQLVFFITDFAARRTVESEVRNRVFYALARAEISMPYPIRDLRVTRGTTPIRSNLVFTRERAKALIAQVDFFDFLPESVRLCLADCARSERYGRGEPIIVEGTTGSDLFVVATGQVAVVTTTSSAAELVLATLGSGTLFGELSLLTGSRGATVKASVESIILRISHADFRHAVEQIPGLTEVLLAQLAQRSEQLARSDEARESAASVEVRRAIFGRIRRLFSAT